MAVTGNAPRPRRLLMTLALADLRNIARDGLLAFLIFLPLAIALAYRFLIPDHANLEALVQAQLPANLEPYGSMIETVVDGIEPVLMSAFVGMSPGLIGAVYGLLLVDERDERTLAVLRVMPISFGQYLLARMVTPCALSLLVTIIAYPLAGMMPLPLTTVILIASAGVTTVPVVVLGIVVFASNKVAALAVMRVMTGVLALPMFAYFATPAQELLAWPIPSFWQMKALWLAADGRAFAWVLVLTVAINIPLSIWLYSRFANRNE